GEPHGPRPEPRRRLPTWEESPITSSGEGDNRGNDESPAIRPQPLRRPVRSRGAVRVAPMARFSQRAQVALETVVLIVCAALVVAFYGALVALVVGVWATRNDVTVRLGMTVFVL